MYYRPIVARRRSPVSFALALALALDFALAAVVRGQWAVGSGLWVVVSCPPPLTASQPAWWKPSSARPHVSLAWSGIWDSDYVLWGREMRLEKSQKPKAKDQRPKTKTRATLALRIRIRTSTSFWRLVNFWNEREGVPYRSFELPTGPTGPKWALSS